MNILRSDTSPSVATLIQRAEELLGVIHGVGADFSNGVTDPTGTIDEGDVYGWRAVAALEEAVRQAKAGAA